MAGFYHTNGSNTSNISKKKKGFNHIGNAHTQNVLEYDGIKFGTVTNKGLKAIENNTLDSYTPATEEEKRAIRSYTAYKSHQETKAEEKQPNTFHPKDIVTSPFSQAVDKAKAEAEAKAKAEEKEAEESKKRFEAFKPNLSTTVNTSFGDVKVDTAPKFTETQINNYAKSQPRVKEKATLNSLYSMTSEEIKPHLKDKNSVAYTTIDGYNIKWKDLYDVAKSYEIIDNVKKSEDFPKASGYKKENFDYEFVKITGQKIIPENKEIAHLYNYINGDKEASNVELRNNIEVYNTSDTPKYKHLTDDEKATFNYLYNTGKTDEAKEFLDAISSELRSRRVEYENSIVAKDASKNPVGASVGSVIANVGNNALALPLMAVDYLEDGSIDENSSLYTNRRTVNTTRNTVENNIDNGVGKFFYRHGMNLADNVATQAVAGFGSLGKVSKAMSGVIMSSGSFVDTTHDAKRRGLSDGKALALGVIAGGAEAYFESKSFDALWGSELLAKSGWGYFLDNAKTELAGELGTELTNDVADVLLSRDYNNFKLEYDGYIKAGDSKKEAWKKTFKTTLDKYGDIALGTIFTSGVMASPGTISVTVSNNNTGKTIRSNERIGEMFDIAQATSEKSSTHNLLSKYGKAGITAEHISDSQIGALYNTAKSEAYDTIMSKKATAEEKISAYKILTKLDEFTLDDTTRGADNTTVAEADAEETTPTVVTPSTLNKGKVDTTPVVTTPTAKGETSETSEQTTPIVNIGDTFKINNNTGSVLRVVGRDDKFTTVEVTYRNGNKETMNFTNEYADSMKASPKFSEIEPSTVENTKVTEVANTNVSNGESSSGVYKRSDDGKLRFNQVDIDYTNTTMRKGQFRIAKADGTYETVDGELYGKYGIHKNNLSGSYSVTLLMAGRNLKEFKTLAEAKKIAMYLDKNTSINDVTFGNTLSGTLSFEQTEELKTYLSEAKRILDNKEYESTESAPNEIQNGKVPFRTKAELVEYVKTHKGDKVKVSFDSGVSHEVRTLEGISNTNLRTKKADGSVVSAELKGVKFNDTGFSIGYSTGVSVMYDFVNVSDNNSAEVLNKHSESDIIVKNTDNEQGEVKADGSIEGYDGSGETQLRENNQDGVYSRTSDRAVEENKSDTERGQGRVDRGNKEEYGVRELRSGGELRRGIVYDVFHGTPYSFSTHEKSYVDLGIHFGTEEQAKARLNKGEGNVLERDLKLKNPLVTQDIFGERTPEQYVEELLEKSDLSSTEKEVLKKAFDNFLKSDIEREAKTSLKDKLNSGKYQIKTKITQDGIVVSLAIIDDVSKANEIPLAELIDKNKLLDILGIESATKILKSNKISKPDANTLYDYLVEAVLPFEIQYLKLREIENILKSFGYDGFAYRNENEGEGWSYAVFDNEQILSTQAPTQNAQNRTDEAEAGAGELNSKVQSQIEAREKKMQAVMARYGLSEDEAYSVLEYKTAEAYKINAKLRDDENLLTDTQKDIVKFLDSALDKLPKYKGKVYRTVSFDDLFNAEEEYNSFLAEHFPNNIVLYDAYTSVSSKPDGHPMPDKTKYGITLEIEGESGRDVDGFGNNFEKEVVYPRGFSFIITDVTKDSKGRPYIKLKEIGENDRQERHTEERSNILQQMSTEEELHSNLHKISEQDTQRSAEAKNPVQRIQTNTDQSTGEIENNENFKNAQNRTDEAEVGAGRDRELNQEDIYDALDKLGLTPDEQYALLEYKSSGSYKINVLLRVGETLTNEQLELKNNTNSAIKRFPIYSGTVYRSIGFVTKDEFEEFVRIHTETKSITYTAFTSSSKTIDGYLVKDEPYSAHYEIESINGRDVSQIGIANEKEVLFATDTTFEILSVSQSKNSVHIKMKEVNQNGKSKFEGALENGRKSRSNESTGSTTGNRRTDKAVSGSFSAVRGRSATYDEVHQGTSDSDGKRIDGGSRPKDLGSDSKTGNDSPRERPLLRIDTTKNEGTKQIADYVAEKLAKGEKLSATELQVISAKAFGGTMADNVYSIKDAYDAMELGVNKYILSMKDISSEKMLELLELLPTQTKRTEEMVKFQQFSTPPSIAYLANYVANVNAKDIMLEPSAGIGGIAVFAKRDGAKVYVNELDNRRLEVLKNMPFDKFFNENAEQLDNILGGKIEPTVIVMNPPFSSSSERNIHNTKIGAKHIEEALKILAPNGRLVAIVGHGMGDGAPAFRDWWKDIKSKYNVKANIRINGKNYNKYGTNFDIQMLVIDKNGATTHTETGYVDTLQELQDKLRGIRNERPTIDYKGTEQKPSKLTRTETSKTGKTADVGNGVISDTDSVTDSGKSTDKSRTSRKPVVKDVQSTDTDGGRTDNQTPETTNEVVDGRGELGGHTELQDSRGTGISDSGQHSEQSNVDRGDGNVRTRQNDVRVQRPKRTELTDSIFEQYQTQPLKFNNTKAHPGKVSESAAMSAITPPAVTYKPHLSQDIVEKGVVSDVQLEAISYAGQSHSQVLPNGTRRGFFLGDGTGIGKGRTIAGMMLDNYNQGRKKALWVTLNSSLVNDAKRDVKALFGNSDLLMQFEGGGKADKIFDKNEAILVVSYSTLSRGYDKKDSNFEKLVKWLGKDFDGLIVFDEAHKMGNATATKGTRGTKKASQTGLAGIALQEALPKSRVVYSSATGATEVENLRYAERLGLWGEGTAFVTGDDFVSKIKAGGLASMELIARDMKAMGVYLSRNISYEDVQYDKITHNLTSQQTKIYDELARSWQIVLQNINKALEDTNQDKDGHARGRALGAFWSSQQRFFNQILTSMQVPSVISDIEKQLADGKSCVIQLVSTNEAAQNQEFERLKSEELDLDEFDLTPKQVLMSMIETSFPVQQFEEYRDDEGNIKSRPVYDSKGNPVLNREAVRQRDELLEKLGSIKVPSSPIDMIINHFGTDLVAENTGRARRVIQKDGKTIEEKIGSKKDADVDAFQNGDKRIIIFSKAGGTGKSYHADKSAKNQQQRVHYLLEAGWQADNAVQGFGRSHRSNQASAPIFKLVTTNLKGQMRFISTIAKRLDQLGAMTKGQRQAGGQGMFSASDNLENSFASDVLAVFYKDLIANRVDGIDNGLAIVEKLGIKDKILDEYNSIKPTAPELREVNKFLNRILSLESSEQNTVFEGYAQRLQEATEKAMIDGTLDKGLENYKADKITLNEVQDIREDERSGAKTKYYNLTAEHKIKPVKFENVPTESKSFVGFYQNKNTGVVRAVMRTSSMTDQYGNVTDNFKLIGQVKNEYIAQYRLYGNWTKIDTAKAETLWNEELTKLPEYRKENLHLISGVVLPVWDKLPTENVRIYRVLTSDGKMLIGRVVSEDMIDETLRRLGSSRKREKIATKDLIEGIKNGDTVHLENGWKIVQRKVSGENRIELIGASYEHADLIKKKGVFTERIQYSTRYFIPSDTNTEKILDEILKLSPVMRVENSKYSSTDVSYDMSSSNDTRKTEYRNYTYNALTSKPDMFVTILDDVNVRDKNGELNRADILKRGIENVRQKNNVKNTEENAYVYIPDIDRDVLVGKKGLSHSLTRNADVVALVTTKIGDILENSIKVNQLSPRENTIGGYILIGIATDKNKNYYPVRVVVNEYSFVEKVEVLDVLYAINAKKRKAGPQTRQGIVENSTPLIKGFSLKNQSSNEAELSANAGSPIKGSSVISISDLLELVKTEFSDVLTDDVLDNLGVERKESNLSDSIIYKSNTNNSYDQASANDRWKTDNAEHSKKKKSDVSLDRIVKKIRTKFGVPISTGKVPHKDARGVYKRKAEVIRTRIANNLPTIAHELGHHLDKLYKFSKMESAKKLTEALPQEFLSQYPTKEQGKEAVAEFVRTYLKSTTEAQKLSAEFYNDFVMTLSKEDLKALNEIASDFNYYLSMEIDEKYKSAIVNSKPTLRERAEDIREGGIEGIKDSVVDKVHDTYTKWVDSFDPIKQAVDFVEKSTEKNLDGTHNAYTLATNSLNATTIASYLVNDGFRDLNGNILEEMSFKECIRGVRAKDLNTLSEYLVLKHSLELINLDMRVFADETLEDVDKINKAIERIEREHPEMIEASENLYQYQRNMLKYYLVDSGLLSEEGFNAMLEKYPCYVPFYRDVSKKQGRAKGTFANQSTPIRRIKGSGASIINPLESIVKNTEKFVKSATRNQVMQVLINYANEAEGFGQFMEKVTPDMLPHVIDITRYKEKFTERLQQTVNAVDYFNVTNLLDEMINDTVMDFTPKANASKKLVAVMENGHASYYQIHDEALYNSIAEMTVPQLEGALKMISKIMLPMKTLMTQMNPLFATSNFFRDYGTAYKHSQINNPIAFTVRYMGALKSIITNDEMYQQYKAMGGGHSSKLATDIDQIKRALHDIEAKDKGKARQLAYAMFRHPLETITSLNDIVESIPRVLEFTKTLQETGDLQQAIYNADDITTNFKRHGSGATAKAVNQFVFFNNASLQGIDKTRRSLTGKDAVSKWTKWALFAFLSSALQYFWNRREDEEGYEQLSSYTKNNFYVYAIGNGKFVAIPKPRETAILDSFTERTIEYVFGNKDAFYDFGGYLADNLLPPMVAEDVFTGDLVGGFHDFFGGTVFGGLSDIGFNKDFMGRPIESKYEQNYLESWERYDEGTSKLAYHLGQTEWARNNDMSPKKIDHLLASSLGIIGSAIQAVFPMDETRKDVTLGLRNRFIKDSVYSTDVINKLWDNTEKAEAQFKFESTIENALEYEQNATITNFVSQMHNAIYALPLEEQREAKKLLLKELNRWDYELTTSQQQMKTSLVDRDIDSNVILDTLPKSLYEWTEGKQKYSYQMTPEEYVSFTKNYLKEIEKYRIWCKKTYTDQNEYIDNLTKANGAVMKYMRPYYNKEYKSKATRQ